MIYKCLDCGHLFEEGEQSHWIEDRGEYFGEKCSEEMMGCPLCNGEYEETVKCEMCGGSFFEYELNCMLCDECINEYKYDVDMCYKIGDRNKESVELNSFLCAMFDQDDIEAILYHELKELEKKEAIDCMCYIDVDRGWFGEELGKEMKKLENKKD